jgi:hypothetical protein
MTLDEAAAAVGAEVEYCAFGGAQAQTCVITDVYGGFVHVRFAGCDYSRSVHPRDLRPSDAVAA